MSKAQTSLRVDSALLARADEISKWLQTRAQGPWMPREYIGALGRSAVLRLALERGLEVLEADRAREDNDDV